MAPNSLTSTDSHHPSHAVSAPSPPPTAARIRENQRRSRARRKEYLQELEQKLRKCEQAGVKASVDIQLAARGVALENQRLRNENERLRGEGEKLRLENERMRAILDGRKEQGCAGVSVGGTYAVGSSCRAIENVTPEAPSQVQNSTDHQMDERTTTTQGAEVPTQHIQAPPKPHQKVPCGSQSNDEMVLGDDTSSCEYAAHIITSMRADITTDDIRADLGCGGDVKELGKCKVDNSKLFVAVDRYAG